MFWTVLADNARTTKLIARPRAFTPPPPVAIVLTLKISYSRFHGKLYETTIPSVSNITGIGDFDRKYARAAGTTQTTKARPNNIRSDYDDALPDVGVLIARSVFACVLLPINYIFDCRNRFVRNKSESIAISSRAATPWARST